MAQPQYPPPETERWNVNLPAVIGVVFVFLIGVVVWVIVASGDDGDDMVSASTSSMASTSVATTTTVAPTTTETVPGTTTPAPMPPPTGTSMPPADPTVPAATNPPPPPPPAPAPAPPPPTEPPPPPPPTEPPPPPTTAAGADPDAVPGDLAIPGYPMQAPPCNDSFITIIASAVGDDVAAEGIEAYLDDYPTSNYLRTDQTCPSLAQNIDGEPIYVVFFGPFPFAADACAARADGTEGSYARTLSETEPPTHTINCPEL